MCVAGVLLIFGSILPVIPFFMANMFFDGCDYMVCTTD